jgi:hypothetical protein
LDFGFCFLPVLSEMGEILEFQCFSVVQNLNFRTKFEQILNFQKNNAKFPKFSRFHLVNHLPVLTEMGEIRTKFDFFEQNLNL